MLAELIDAASKKCDDRLTVKAGFLTFGLPVQAELEKPSPQELSFLSTLRSQCRNVNTALLAELREAAINNWNLTIRCTIVSFLKEIKAILPLSEIVTHGKDDSLSDFSRALALIYLAEIDKKEAKRIARQIIKKAVPGNLSKELRYCAYRILHPYLYPLFVK